MTRITKPKKHNSGGDYFECECQIHRGIHVQNKTKKEERVNADPLFP